MQPRPPEDDNVIQLRPMATPADVDVSTEPTPQAAESKPVAGEMRPPADHLVDAAVEALLFAAEGPMTTRQIDGWLAHPGMERVQDALHGLELHYRRMGGGIELARVAKGWQLRTDPRLSPWVAHMRGGKPMRLSKAALEALSIVAYRQPVTRSELEELRGVDSGGVLRLLCERRLCTVLGRKDEPGRPLLYGTTTTFLSLFGLRDLSDLPTLRDLRELELDDPRSAASTQLDLPLDDDLPLDETLRLIDAESLEEGEFDAEE